MSADKRGLRKLHHAAVGADTGAFVNSTQVATDSLVAMETAMARDGIHTNDRQLACARINSKEGQDYLVRNGLLTAPRTASFRMATTVCSCHVYMTAGGYGVRCELRMGQSKLDDVSLPAGTFARSSLQISLLWSDACLRRHLQRCSRARPTILTCTLFMMCRTTLQRYVMTLANHLVFAV